MGKNTLHPNSWEIFLHFTSRVNKYYTLRSLKLKIAMLLYTQAICLTCLSGNNLTIKLVLTFPCNKLLQLNVMHICNLKLS